VKENGHFANVQNVLNVIFFGRQIVIYSYKTIQYNNECEVYRSRNNSILFTLSCHHTPSLVMTLT